MVVGSFLVKHLGLDWRRGEHYFALQLNDFEKGEKLAEYAADLSKKLLGADDSTTSMVLNLWAVCAEARGKDKKAAQIRARIVG